MSAFLVGHEHIDAMIRVATNGPLGTSRKSWYPPMLPSGEGIVGHAHELGRMLWTQNYKSVAYHYNDFTGQDLPGPIGLTIVDIEGYSYQPHLHQNAPTSVEALKLIACYEYQSCEDPGWEDSYAKQFCEALRSALIGALPGYEEAPWEWDR